MKNNKKIVIYILNTLGLLFLFTGIATQDADKTYYLRIKKDLQKIEEKNITNETEINKLIYKAKLTNKVYQEDILEDIKDYKTYISTKELFNKYCNNNEIIKPITEEDIKTITKLYKKNSTQNKKKLNEEYLFITNQYNNMKSIEQKIKDLFQDENYQNIKEDIEKSLIDNYLKELEKIHHKDFVEKQKQHLKNAKDQINAKEQAIIDAAWVKINVPYISQNKNNILNGCEAAAMLMALQYKGYLTNTSLSDYVKLMPLSANNNPYEGFTHDIYGLQPLTIPHWIAPPPLAQFGKDTSGNQNIIDSTGYTIDQLDRELDNNNPVIIYLIAKFNEPKETVEGAPRNLHVMLLTGYNKITGEHYIVDPWTHDDGRTSWTVSKELIENRYNYVGKKSVIVK